MCRFIGWYFLSLLTLGVGFLWLIPYVHMSNAKFYDDISKGQKLSSENIWVKRPGTGEIYAENYNKILNKTTKIDIKKNTQLEWNMFE